MKARETFESANEIEMNDNILYGHIEEDSGWVGVADASENPVREKSYQFALTIIGLYSHLQGQREYVISKQPLRSGTGIGANVEEAIAAESRRDFVHKMALASKEARETVYWLRLLSDSDLVPDLDVSAELGSARELVRLLTSIVKATAQSR